MFRFGSKVTEARFKKMLFTNVTEKTNFECFEKISILSFFARLPVLDSAETIEIIKKYLETGNFSVFEVLPLFNANTRSVIEVQTE